MITHDTYRLRAIEKEDIPFLIDLRNHPETQKYLGTLITLTVESQEKWIDSLPSRKDCMFLMFDHRETVESEWTPIGLARWTELDYVNGSACVGGDIDIKYRGKGHGKELYKLIFDLGFNQLNFHRLWLFVLEYNATALGLYYKMGFTKEGCQRKAIYRDGTYHDYIMMSILEDEYRALYK